MFKVHLQKYSLGILLVIAFVLTSNDLFGQIKGKVTDSATGETLIGVNVVNESDSFKGAVTNIDGDYAIDVKAGDRVIFSYVGYNDYVLEVVNDDEAVYNISLVASSEVIEQFVVVGYGSVQKKDLTGVVAKVGEEDFNKGVVSSPEKLLTGKVAGLQITNNGEPGGGSRIVLRGASSLTAGSSPLIVIDGVPIQVNGAGYNPLNFINPSDVEDITVLKDASASAIYGSRGANGVIIITTKSGKKGGLKVDYTGNGSVSFFNNRTASLSPEAFRNAINLKDPGQLPRLGDASTDWVDAVTQDARNTEHNLTFSGGNDKVTFRVTGGYLNNNGVIRTSNHTKMTLGANLDFKLLNDDLRISVRSKFADVNERYALNVLGTAIFFDPTQEIYDEDSPFGGFFQHSQELAARNPVSTIELVNNTGHINRYLNSATINYDLPFVDGLSLNTQVSYDLSRGEGTNFSDPLLRQFYNNGGYLGFYETEEYSSSLEAYFSYDKEFKSIGGKLNFVGGYSWQEKNARTVEESGFMLVEENGEWMYTDTLDVPLPNRATNRLISFYGRANFNLKEKYLLTASLRRDGSTRFGAENRWGYFPSAAFAWRMLEEPFLAGLKNTFTDLKFRASYGSVGNEQFRDYLYFVYYSYGTGDATYQFGDEFVNTLRGVGVDPGIKWEETQSLNLGLDFGFFNNRLTGSLDVYRKFTKDMLFRAATSAFTNLSDQVVTNIGEMENKGVELLLNAVVADKENFDWNLSFNAAYNINEIVKLDNADISEGIIYPTGGISGDVGQTIQVLRVGNQINSFYTYNHIYDSNGLPLVDGVDHNGDGIVNLQDIYEDINADGKINEDDLVVKQGPEPRVTLGLTSNVSWRNWSLAATFRASFGNWIYNNVSSANGYFDRLYDFGLNNIHESAFLNTNFKNRQLKSDYYLENGSYMKLDNITLSYQFNPKKVFKGLSVFTTASNILTLSGYSGMDPELALNSNGIDNNLYPAAFTIVAGVNANF
jgi:TonB-linked SusC/RagA family outer membrane protein